MSPSPPHPAPAQGLEQITSDIKHMAAVRKEKRREEKKVFFFKKKRKRKEKKNGVDLSTSSLLPSLSPSILSPFSLFVLVSLQFLVSPERTEKIASTRVSPAIKGEGMDV